MMIKLDVSNHTTGASAELVVQFETDAAWEATSWADLDAKIRDLALTSGVAVDTELEFMSLAGGYMNPMHDYVKPSNAAPLFADKQISAMFYSQDPIHPIM